MVRSSSKEVVGRCRLDMYVPKKELHHNDRRPYVAASDFVVFVRS